MGLKLVVTPAKFDEHFSIDDWFRFTELSNKELYAKMLLFACDAETGQELTEEQARAEFRKIPKSEWSTFVRDFFLSVRDAYVNPTSAGG